MSKISLTPNASGTGTFTIASPNGNTDRNINLPDSNGTILTTATPGVPVNGPAFSAYAISNQSVSAATNTKVTLAAETFDTNSNFLNSTFTPTVAGYYQLNYSVYFNAGFNYAIAKVLKNGVAVTYNEANGGGSSTPSVFGSYLVYMNGSTDYLELYTYVNNANAVFGRPDLTYFQAFLARSAT